MWHVIGINAPRYINAVTNLQSARVTHYFVFYRCVLISYPLIPQNNVFLIPRISLES